MESEKLNSEVQNRVVVAKGWGAEEMGRYWSKGTNFHLQDWQVWGCDVQCDDEN